MQIAGVEPDVWKIEGLDRRKDCEKIVKAARRGDRDKVGCIILGCGEDDRKVHEWLAVVNSYKRGTDDRPAPRSYWLEP